jgi:SAM-dependent methyltransferase
METDSAAILQHYGHDQLGERILAALTAAGYDLDRLTPDDLAPIDQFHMGGKEATLQLLQRSGLPHGANVLDVGGGIGGPARTLASALGATVTVLDLSQSFCDAGAMLTERLGVSGQVSFRQGDALAMPFADGSFGAAWTQHSSMNIANKAGLYAEIHRVLRPGGRLVIHEVMAGPNAPVHFPVPWARRPEMSALMPPAETRALIAAAGFTEVAWVDVTRDAIAFWQRRLSAPPATPPPVGLHMLFGPEWAEITQNTVRNLNEGRISVVQAVFDRA